MSARPALSNSRVAILAYNGLRLFEFGVAMEAFAYPRPELDAWYQCTVAAGEPGPWELLGGVTGSAAIGLEALEDAGTIIIPGWRDHRETPPATLLAALKAAALRGARFVSICAGAFVLGAAGVLDGRRATTHWAFARAFRKRFPKVRLVADVLYVDDGDIVTSAGSAAGIDTCLHVIRRDFGARVANHIARGMVVPLHREGGQAQLVEAPVNLRSERGLGELLEWARVRLDQPLTIADLARRAAMSERTLLRRFIESTGVTPKAWLTRERLHRAQTLLETTQASLDAVAEASGFNSVESFRIAFRRAFKTSPARYRAGFRERSPGLPVSPA